MVCNRFDETRELGNNYIAVRQGYKWGLLDGNSNVFMRIIYDYISEENGMLWARYCGHKFNIPHEWLPMHYDCIYDFVEFAPKKKWAKVALNGKYGVINQDFAEIIPCEFDEITDYNGAIWAGKSFGKLKTTYAVYSYEGNMFADCCYDGICYPVVPKTINGETLYSIIDRQSKEILKGINIKTIKINKGIHKTLNLYDIERETGFHYLYSVEKGLKDIGYNTIENVKLFNKSFWVGYRFQHFPHYDDSTPKEMWMYSHDTSVIYGDVYFEDHYLLSYNYDECVLISHISEDYFVYQSERNSKYGIICSNGFVIPNVYDTLSYEGNLHIVVGIRDSLYEEIQHPTLYDSFMDEYIYKKKTERIGGIVDIFNEKGEIVIQDVDLKDWNPKKSFFCEGYLQLNIGEKQYVFKNRKMIVSSGYYDEIGLFVIPCGYLFLDKEYALVQKNGKWGVINSEGNLLIPIKYDEIKVFLKCRVVVNGNYYYKYKYLKAKKEGRCCFFEANKELKRVDGIVIKDILDNNLVDYPDDYWRYDDEELLDKISEEIIKDKPKGKDLSQKRFRVTRNYQNANCYIAEDVKSKKIGLLNENEQKLCDFIYDSISDFNKDGIAIARIKGEGEGLIDQNGHIILPCKYKLYVGNNSESRYRQDSSMPEFTEGYLAISFNEKFGLVDKKGQIVVPCEYPRFVTFQEYRQLELLKHGYVLVENENYEGLIQLSSSDDYLLNCCYKEIEIHSNRKHSLYGYDEPDSATYIYGIGDNLCTVLDINTNTIVSNLHCSNVSSISIIFGNYIIVEISQRDSIYYSIYTLYSQKHVKDYSIIGYCNGRSVQVSKEGKWGIFDLELGKEIIPCEYYEEEDVAGAYYRRNHKIYLSFLLTSDSDYVVIRKNGKYGVIDNNNKCVIECKYDSVRPFKEGRAAVLIGFDWSFINEYGETIANGFEEVEDFSEGFAAVKKNGKWGYINTYGKTIIPYRFSKADSFSDGLAAVAFKTKYGYIDKHNKTIIPFKYEEALSFEEGVAEVRNQDGSGTISKDGIIIDWKYKEKPYYDNTDYARDTWDAMTDGQYGDMPEGFDGDYDWLGY